MARLNRHIDRLWPWCPTLAVLALAAWARQLIADAGHATPANLVLLGGLLVGALLGLVIHFALAGRRRARGSCAW